MGNAYEAINHNTDNVRNPHFACVRTIWINHTKYRYIISHKSIQCTRGQIYEIMYQVKPGERNQSLPGRNNKTTSLVEFILLNDIQITKDTSFQRLFFISKTATPNPTFTNFKARHIYNTYVDFLTSFLAEVSFLLKYYPNET